MFELLIGLLVLALVVVFGVAFVEAVLRDTYVGAATVMVLSVLSTFLDSTRPTPVIAGITFLPEDWIFVLIAGAGVLRLMRVRELHLGQRLVLVILGVIFVSIVRGVGVNGVQDTFRESRDFLYFFGGTLYFATADLTPDLRRRLARLLVLSGLAFTGIVLFRWAALFGGLPATGIFTRQREAGGIRVIDNQNTLLVAQATFLLVPVLLSRHAQRWMKLGVAVTVPVMLIIQHRTIWIILLAATGVVAVRNPRFGRRAVAGVVGGVLAIGIVTAALSQGPGGRDVLPQDPTSASTLIWRFEGWRAIVNQEPSGPDSLLLGRPMGSGYERRLERLGWEVDVVPHNFYIQTYLRTGAVGLLAMLSMLGLSLATLRRQHHDVEGLSLSGEALFLALTMQTIFMIAWTPDMDQGIITGLALAHAFGWKPRMVTDRLAPALRARASAA